MGYTIYMLLVLIIIISILTTLIYREFNSDKLIPSLIQRRKTPPKSDIPADVYMSWKSHSIPPKMYQTIMDNIHENPEFNFHIYSDAQCEQYIKDNYGPEVVKAFNTLKPGAYKSDLWRYCIMYKKGGIYMDIKFKAYNPLREFLKNNETVFVKDLTRNFIYQGILVAKSNEPIFLEAINQIVKNCNKKYYGKDPLDPTGPGLIGKIIDEYKLHYMIKLYNSENPIKISRHRIDIYYTNDVKKKKLLFRDYDEYRLEQKKYTNKQPHYNDAWHARNIYN